jgi:hypothetical protein
MARRKTDGKDPRRKEDRRLAVEQVRGDASPSGGRHLLMEGGQLKARDGGSVMVPRLRDLRLRGRPEPSLEGEVWHVGGIEPYAGEGLGAVDAAAVGPLGGSPAERGRRRAGRRADGRFARRWGPGWGGLETKGRNAGVRDRSGIGARNGGRCRRARHGPLRGYGECGGRDDGDSVTLRTGIGWDGMAGGIREVRAFPRSAVVEVPAPASMLPRPQPDPEGSDRMDLRRVPGGPERTAEVVGGADAAGEVPAFFPA